MIDYRQFYQREPYQMGTISGVADAYFGAKSERRQQDRGDRSVAEQERMGGSARARIAQQMQQEAQEADWKARQQKLWVRDQIAQRYRAGLGPEGQPGGSSYDPSGGADLARIFGYGAPQQRQPGPMPQPNVPMMPFRRSQGPGGSYFGP